MSQESTYVGIDVAKDPVRCRGSPQWGHLERDPTTKLALTSLVVQAERVSSPGSL